MQRFVWLCFGVFIFLSCQKYRLSQPAFINFGWRYENNSEVVELNSMQFYLTDFSISGQRKEGEDVLLTKPIPEDVQISFTGDGTLGINMDVPVGEYESFIVTMNVPKKAPSLRFNGTCIIGEQEVALRVEWYDAISLDLAAITPFELKKKKSYTMNLSLNVSKLFEDVSANQWSQVDIPLENGVPTLVVNKYTTPGIFNDVDKALESALYVTAP